MIDDQDSRTQDDAVAKELDGVPADMIDEAGDASEQQTGVNEALDSLRNDLEQAKQETLYAKAETQNVRRRMEKDVADARAYAATGFARDILSVADNLERGLAAIPEELRADDKFKGLVAGLEATGRELAAIFQRQGITRIAAMGLPLDPNRHQAMLEVPSADAEPGTIVQEMQAGYTIKDRLLRPALVGVAKKPE